MARIFQVAKYIVSKIGEITTMKLQKLAYYCQAWSLAWDDKPLFDDDFEAWANGPVNRDLFQKFKGKFTVTLAHFTDIPDGNFTDEELKTISAVLLYYGGRTPLWLSELIHQERPWLEARKGIEPGMACSNIISKDIMQEYYGGLVGND